MQTPSIAFAAQYVTDISFIALVKPYENKEAVSVHLSVQSRAERVEQSDTWRVELDVTVTGSAAASGDNLYIAAVSQEAIVVITDAPEQVLESTLRLQVPARLFANARVKLSNLTMETGYGPLTLPPVQDSYIRDAFEIAPALDNLTDTK